MPVISRSVSVLVPATSANLGPGFDSLGLAFSLHNKVTLSPAQSDQLSVRGEGAAQLSLQSTTIAHAAAHRVFGQLKLEKTGFHLVLHNAIPLSRGLGSSSAAIVGGLFAANEWAKKYADAALSTPQLLDLATEIEGHPDNVAPALLGGLVVSAMGEAGRVSALRVEAPRFPRFTAWIPEAELATKTARGVLPATYSRADAIFNLSRSALLVAALSIGDFSVLREALRDKIHQDYRAPLIPGFEGISRAAQEAGAFGVTLSGAGPSILAWSPREIRVLSAMERAAHSLGIAGRALELDVELQGCHAVENGAETA